MNYGRLDPLGKGYVGNRVGAAAIESEFGSDLEIFTEVENCWRREYSRGGEFMPGAVEDCQGVYDERQRNSGQEKAAAAENDRGRSTGPVDRRAQHAQELERSTGPVDRRALTDKTQLSGFFGRPSRSTGSP